jgi:hypothetical protein
MCVPLTACRMQLRCPHCDSTDLKRLALVYQAGSSQIRARTRLRGLIFGEGGPSVFTAGATTDGNQQSELAKSVAPPLKWSYTRLVVRAALVTVAAFIACVIFVIVSTPPVSTLPMKLYVFLAPAVFCVCLFLTWRHNTLIFPRGFADWDRSFLCERCGKVSLQDSAGR